MDLMGVVTFGGRAVHGEAFGVGVAGTIGAFPPLGELGHGGIVESHVGADAVYFPAGGAEADAHFGFFAGDDGGIEAIDLLEGFSADECVAAAGECFADGGVPFDVGESVVDGGVGELLAAAPADNTRLWLVAKRSASAA